MSEAIQTDAEIARLLEEAQEMVNGEHVTVSSRNKLVLGLITALEQQVEVRQRVEQMNAVLKYDWLTLRARQGKR